MLHAADHIRLIQQGEREHKHTKGMFGRTNKKDIALGITRQEHRQSFFCNRDEPSSSTSTESEGSVSSPTMDVHMHHQMSHSTRSAHNIYALARDLANDPAAKVGAAIHL